MGGEVRSEETRRLLLLDHDIPRSGSNRCDDFVAVDIVVNGAARLVAARALPTPAAGIPIVRGSLPGSVDDRQLLGACRLDQRFDVFEGTPGLLTAGGAPALDRLQDGFRALAAERPIDVDNKQRRPLPESSSGAEPTCGEYGLVALGEEFVPDPLAHRHRSLPWCTGRSLTAKMLPISSTRGEGLGGTER